MTISVWSPVSPVENIVDVTQDPFLSVAYFKSSIVSSWYEICILSFESTAMEVKCPTILPAVLSIVLTAQEPLLSVAYFKSPLVSSKYEICMLSVESIAISAKRPTSGVDWMVVITQEPLSSVA